MNEKTYTKEEVAKAMVVQLANIGVLKQTKSELREAYDAIMLDLIENNAIEESVNEYNRVML